MDKFNISDEQISEEILKYDQLCSEYKLIGVVIHSGVADHGHYYSLINTDKNTKKDMRWEGTQT